jgi:hypothetical protein
MSLTKRWKGMPWKEKEGRWKEKGIHEKEKEKEKRQREEVEAGRSC